MVDRYLVDNVTLSRMTAEQRASPFMRNRCRIPEEILYEARGLPDIELLKPLIYPITTTVLENVKVVLATIKAGDKVVDLYRNEGNGDVMLLATALTEMAVTAEQLFGDRWIIATADKGLTSKAVELGVLTCTSDQFIELV
ncbi:hypothetical protein [Blastococcus sp. PRF04-17]|uniref:hypothetical protein n=1 Tax=Blastococcus sp. PRF04-17 TaxID=2933797 RepID=UPI001FF43D58|nr:hypothetical protein [Blastococcus sp. PRF04-17]UOY02450.1 hypothetical protein MVA48_03415 [Blastococcus sp. PRF04-17]